MDPSASSLTPPVSALDQLMLILAQVCLFGCLFGCLCLVGWLVGWLFALLGLTNERFGAALRAATGATQAAARPAAHPAGARGLFVCLLSISHTHTHTHTHTKLHICDLLVCFVDDWCFHFKLSNKSGAKRFDACDGLAGLLFSLTHFLSFSVIRTHGRSISLHPPIIDIPSHHHTHTNKQTQKQVRLRISKLKPSQSLQAVLKLCGAHIHHSISHFTAATQQNQKTQEARRCSSCAVMLMHWNRCVTANSKRAKTTLMWFGLTLEACCCPVVDKPCVRLKTVSCAECLVVVTITRMTTTGSMWLLDHRTLTRWSSISMQPHLSLSLQRHTQRQRWHQWQNRTWFRKLPAATVMPVSTRLSSDACLRMEWDTNWVTCLKTCWYQWQNNKSHSWWTH